MEIQYAVDMHSLVKNRGFNFDYARSKMVSPLSSSWHSA